MNRPELDFGLYFFGNYSKDVSAGDAYETLFSAARFADERGFSSLWVPERHFHSFGGIFPNPSVLAAALSRETFRIRLNAGSVVLPLHDVIRVAEEWSVVDNMSGGRVGIGCATGWDAEDFVFYPDRFGRHREIMYAQLSQLRKLWRGQSIDRVSGSGEDTAVSLRPRPVQAEPPMYVAVLGRRESFADAARHDLGIITNLMAQDVGTLADNIAYYRDTRARNGLDPQAGKVTVLMHTYLDPDADAARDAAFGPLCEHMRTSKSLFGRVINSLGFEVDPDNAEADDLTYLFERAYHRFCAGRTLVGSPESCAPMAAAVRDAGVDEIAALVDFGVPSDLLLAGLGQVEALRGKLELAPPSTPEAAPEPDVEAPRESIAVASASQPSESFPLSAGQRRLWLLEQRSPEAGAQNEPKAVRLRGGVDADALRAALDALVVRHTGLRTVFREIDGEPRQIVQPPRSCDFTFEDRAGRGEDEVAAEALEAESRRRFDLGNGPLFAVRLLRVAEDSHVLVLSLHHIAADAVSTTVLTRDLSELYAAQLEDRAVQLPELERRPADFAAEAAAAETDPQSLKYWREQLSGELPVLRLPEDRPRPATPKFTSRAHVSVIGEELSRGLRELSARSGTTLFMTLLAGLAATLQRFSPADDVVVGVPASQRPEGSEDLVGCFVNTLALRFDLSGDPAFTELLKRVRRTALDAHDHADVPFDEVVEAVGPPDDATRTPIFQVLAEYKSVDTFALDLPGVEATPLDAGREAALTDLALFLTRRGEETVCHVEYNAELFDAATIERISGYFQLALSAAVADPDSPLSRLVGLSEPDRNALTAWQHGEDVPIPATSVPEMLAAVAHHCPDAAAVAGDDALLTYRELDAAANRLAGRLAGFGVEPGETVAVWMPRSARLVTALLAVLKTGAAYLPLDPGLGPARVKTVLTDSRARLVLTSKEAAAALPAPRNVEVMVDDPAHDPEPPWEIPRTPQAGDAAYVIYTSGSTGRPKGVAVSHRGLTNLCQWFRRRFDFTPADRAAAVCGQSFDASVLEVWPALAAGASVLIAPESVCADAKDLAGWYARVQATFTLLPTALGEEILALPEAARLPLSTMVLGGDVLRRRPPGGLRYEVVNAYGPAEATVLASTHSVAPQGPDSIPIGRPVDNTRLYVLDHAGRPAPVGVVGELFIGGPCVANGYLHAPELTALRFIADPGGGQDDRLYRTGDLVRWNSDGELEFRGRVDDQLKVRGFRVEPGDATQALKASPDVADGVVLGKRGPDGEAYLAGYLVPGNADVTPETTMDAMRTLVPEYLVPQAWAVVEALPRDASGKLRRDALPETTALVDAPRPARDHSAGPQGLFDEVRTLWASMLGRPIEDVRADSDFFALGGHAVVLRLLSQARERFDVSYPVVEFYQKPTVAAMVEHIGRAGASAEDVVESGPVSFQQNATVREAAEAPEGRNTTLHMNLGGDVDAGALRTALTAVAERHQSLRTRFTQIDGAWTQEVLANGDQELPVVDLRHLSPPQALTRADELCDEAAGEVMTPAEGRLWRSRLLRLAEDRWRLLIVVHHAVCDGWSTTVLLRDLAEAYAQARAGKAVELPSATQSIDYARWQLMQHDQTVEAERIQYWKRRLNGSTVDVAVPADRPPSSAATASAHFVRRRVDGAVIASVNDLARRQGCTEFAVWAAALGVLISRLDGSSRLALGVPHAARESAEHDSVVSVLTSVSILGMDLSGDICFADLVAAVVRDYFEGIDSFVPLRRLLDALAAERGDEIPKTMPVMLTYQGALDRQVSLPDLAAEVEERTWLAAGRRQLTFFVEPDDGQWNYGVVCNGDIYDPATPEGWMRQWLRILAQGVAAPETPVSALLG